MSSAFVAALSVCPASHEVQLCVLLADPLCYATRHAVLRVRIMMI